MMLQHVPLKDTNLNLIICPDLKYLETKNAQKSTMY